MPRFYYQIITITGDAEEDTETLNTWAARGWAVDQLRDDIALLKKPMARARPTVETREG